MDSRVADAPVRAQSWRAVVAPYERTSNWRAGLQLAITWIALGLVFALMYQMMLRSAWLPLVLAVPAGLLLVRTFIVMHDCAHGSFFTSRRANGALGWLCGVITMTPFAQWRRDHARHHASSGDLDRRGHGDVPTLTLREYHALSRGARFRYRLLRHPAVLLGFGPLHMIVTQRVRPPGTKLGDPDTRSVWSTNVGIVALAVVCVLTLGWSALLLVYLPAIYFAAAVGIWLFYVQHQFEQTYWVPHSEWNYLTASIRGSSYLRLPRVLAWFTGDIGVHHVHHLSPRIPNYRLQQCHEENVLFHDVTTITVGETWRLFRLALWDEERGSLVSFAAAPRRAASTTPRSYRPPAAGPPPT
jgi:omega-6 fatty acid desaturase (delta-12 desaturase)